MGERFLPIPWRALQPSPEENTFLLDLDPEVLKSAPSFDKPVKNRWAMVEYEYLARVYRYYDYPPYWQHREEVQAGPGSSSSSAGPRSEEPEQEYQQGTGGIVMPHDKLSINQFAAMRGKPVYSSDGEKLGDVEGIYYDPRTNEPEWFRVKTGILGGILGAKHFLVPVEGAQFQGGADPSVRVPYTQDQVNNSPEIDQDEVPEAAAGYLYAHYRLRPAGLTEEADMARQEVEEPGVRPGTPTGEVSVPRHEEELRVGRREVERGRVRLRKWVETEPVTEEVHLRRETAHLQRQPVDRPAPGAQLGEQEVELTLHEEQPVVEKETVEKERITLRKEEETRRETVSGETREEQVEVEGDVEEEHRHR
jgi:stress response protein YsnF